MTTEERRREDLAQAQYITEWTRNHKERKLRRKIYRMQAGAYWRLWRKNIKDYLKAIITMDKG